MRFLLFVSCLMLFFSCQPKSKPIVKPDKSENKSSKDSLSAIYVNQTVMITAEKEARKNKQIDLLESFFKADWSYENYKDLLFQGDNLPKYPLSEIQQTKYGHTQGYYKPILLSLTDIAPDLSVAKVGFFRNQPRGFTSLTIIYNFLIVKKDDGFKLTNMINYNTRNWQKRSSGRIKIFAYPTYQFNEEDISKMHKFNQRIADYFNVDPI